MANIYEEKNEPLHELMSKANNPTGATLLIPDLQRPYVWKPNQAVLLVDSLIRGWPFGTLLLWKVRHEELKNIPSRPFWRVVDRTVDEVSETVDKKNPPAEFQMVLDGQQRVQSLLLALGGDDWGFKLEDRDWAEEVQDRPQRGRQGKKRHWSKVSLAFDLLNFLGEYKIAESRIWDIDFKKVLCWVVTDNANGQSTWSKPPTHQEVLLKAYAEDNKGRFVRLSRLWNEAQPHPNLKEGDFRRLLEPFLQKENVSEARIKDLLAPLAELMTTFRDVKLGKVTYLELRSFDKTIWTQDSYNDAIVNIFTRLNTGGRTLTREEITFAWLKTVWDKTATENRGARECFEALNEELGDLELKLTLDDLVAGVSFVWSSVFNDGSLLSNKDLLRGDIIRPMAAHLAANWKVLCGSILDVTESVKDRSLHYGTHYQSLNALSFLWAWKFIADLCLSQRDTTEPARDAFQKKTQQALDECLDRWLICSQWAGRWGQSSAPIVSGYARGLMSLYGSLIDVKTLPAVNTAMTDHLKSEVKALEQDAVAYLDGLDASSRNQVRGYVTPLWVWHRSDAERWRISKIQLRENKRKKIKLDVDHIVSVKLWDRKTTAEEYKPSADEGDAGSGINQLGNCFLLEKSFNISKKDKSLKSFLDQVLEIKEGKVTIEQLAKALCLDMIQVDPTTADCLAVQTAFEARTETMKRELVEFVRGAKTRVDL